MSNKDYSIAMNNAEASIRMEGLTITPNMTEQSQCVFEGEASTSEVVCQFTVNHVSRQPTENTVAAMLEAERIAHDPSVKGFKNLDKLFVELDNKKK